jgi:hypothetical protein
MVSVTQIMKLVLRAEVKSIMVGGVARRLRRAFFSAASVHCSCVLQRALYLLTGVAPFDPR